MQRFACTLISLSMLAMLALVAMLLGDAFAPARLPLRVAVLTATSAGVLLLLGLWLLEGRREAKRVRWG